MLESQMLLEEDELRAARKSRFPHARFGPSLESAYQTYRYQRLVTLVPTISIAALALILFFAYLDYVTLPKPAYQISIAIRLLFICPMILLLMYAAKNRWPSKVFGLCYAVVYAFSGLGIIAIIYAARAYAYPLPYDGLMLFLVFGYFVMNMPFVHATASGVLVSLAYFGMEIALDTETSILASNAMFMTSLNFIGAFGGYMQERSRRLLYLSIRLLELAKERDKNEIASKTRLLATASHDLRQPLHAMNLLIETLQKQPLNDTAQTLTQQLRASTRQLSQLLSSLLNISRLNAGIVEAKPQTCDLSLLMHTLAEDQRLRAKESHLKIQIEGPSPCWITTDPILLERIVRNLFENVFEHANANQLTLQWGVELDSAYLDIADDGCGVRMSDQERIFEEFQQSGESQRQGMGLGLAIVRQLCDILNMPLQFDSDKNKGSHFHFDLPLAPAPAEQTTPSSGDAKQTPEDAHIFVIDDDEAILKSTGALLSSWGYKVSTSSCPKSALKKFESLSPDLLLCDYRFEGSATNGIELTQALRSKLETALPTILISADTDGNLENKMAELFSAEEKKMTGLAFKPLMPARLRLMLKHYLR
jgi:two-component system, sensor histidine kinase